jgi:hypothetical protein
VTHPWSKFFLKTLEVLVSQPIHRTSLSEPQHASGIPYCECPVGIQLFFGWQHVHLLCHQNIIRNGAGQVTMFPFLSFLHISNSSSTILTWLINLSTAARIIDFIGICVTYICFYRACQSKDSTAALFHTTYDSNHSVDTLHVGRTAQLLIPLWDSGRK